jgi:hypothetical protein
MSSALPPNVEEVLQVLQQAVTAELERKRGLGHYTITWEDGRAVVPGLDAPQPEP